MAADRGIGIEVQDGRVVHVARMGRSDGSAMVLVNSLGTDLRLWDAMLPFLEPRFSLLRFDKRGHGLSDVVPGPYSMSGLAEDLAALLDRLRIGPAIVVGVSIGGMIAQALAAARPDLVRGLVLIDTGHRIGNVQTWNDRIAAVRAGGIEAIADGVMERWFSAEFRRTRPTELALWRNMLMRTPIEGYLGCCAAIRDADLTEGTRGIRVPTLCLAGERDIVTPPSLAEELAGLIEGASYAVISGCGHLPCIEAPEMVARAVLDLVEEHDLG